MYDDSNNNSEKCLIELAPYRLADLFSVLHKLWRRPATPPHHCCYVMISTPCKHLTVHTPRSLHQAHYRALVPLHPKPAHLLLKCLQLWNKQRSLISTAFVGLNNGNSEGETEQSFQYFSSRWITTQQQALARCIKFNGSTSSTKKGMILFMMSGCMTH